MSSSSSSSGGIGFVGLLQIVFITLKLCGVITWTWFYVLLPMIISTALVCFCLVAIFAIYLLKK
jgi:hypothetical protein